MEKKSRWIRQMLAGILLACTLAVAMPADLLVAMAASAKITFSDPSGEVGQEVSVNMKVSSGDGSLGRAEIMLAYDASILEFLEGSNVEGGAGALRAHGGPDGGDLSTISFTMKFRVLQPATSQITVTSCEIYDADSQAATIAHQGSSTITVAPMDEGAAASLLSSLTVAPGTLEPAFSPYVDSYSMSVGLDVDRIDVQAAGAEGAAIAVEGSEGLQMGENTITIKVTAADGVTVKNYTISVTKSEGGGSETGGAPAVEGVSLEAAAKAITILPPEEGVDLPEVFSKTTINIDGYEVTGWIWAAETEHQYCVFYAMNAAGEKDFYRYDLTEKTIQRYFKDPTAESGYTKEETESFIAQHQQMQKDYQFRLYVIIVLVAVSVLLLIFVIVLLATRNSGGGSGKGKDREDRGARESMARSRGAALDGPLQDEGEYARIIDRTPIEQDLQAEMLRTDRPRAESPRTAQRTSSVSRTPSQGARREITEPVGDLDGDFEPLYDDGPQGPAMSQTAMDQEQRRGGDLDDDFEIVDLD
ncbi:MAG: hypothetical protein HFG22_08430 [Lachnospiraceae bacterium]|nr:hypothetical protein [Lachnospiraceae bacterium]